MATTVDFQVITKTDFPNLSLVIAQNEDAFSYITEEEWLDCRPDGSVILPTPQVRRFISDAENAHLCAAFA